MKQLLLLRHAKSSWQDPALDDHQRPLNKRGQRDAPRMGNLIVSQQLVPDLIVSSSALRARQTAAAVALCCGDPDLVQETDQLYLAPPSDYLSLLADLDDAHQRVLLVGHNPGISQLVEQLCGQASGMPTAALAALTVDIDCWTLLDSTDSIQLSGYWIPRELDD